MTLLRVSVARRLGGLSVEAAFTMPDAGLLALFGPSGAGKTSIVNMIAGLLDPDRGYVEVQGRPVFDSERGLNLPPHRRRIGYVFQDGRLFPHLTVAGNLKYGRRDKADERRGAGFDDVVDLLGIRNILGRRPHRLSGGEKQRTALGRALLSQPDVLLMDEPVNSVDWERKNDILRLVRALPERFGVPIVYVSHFMDEIEALSAEVLPVRDGKANRRTASPGAGDSD